MISIYIIYLSLIYNVSYFLFTYATFCHPSGSHWHYEEEIDIQSHRRIIKTSSCPNHFHICQESRCGGPEATIAHQFNITYSIPLYPAFSSSPKDTTCRNGTIAIALNGVSIQSASYSKEQCISSKKGAKESVYLTNGDKRCNKHGYSDGIRECGDAIQEDGQDFDVCGGHADEHGLYHYHIPPTCLIHQLSSASTQEDEVWRSVHSPQIGWALDGFPIYGPIGPNGVSMAPCGHAQAHPILCLDRCNGYMGALPGIDSYFYRYYLSGPLGNEQCAEKVNPLGKCNREDSKCCVNMVPPSTYRPYTLGCFRGCTLDDKNCIFEDNRGTTDTFIPQISSYAKEIYTLHLLSNYSDPNTLIPAAPNLLKTSSQPKKVTKSQTKTVDAIVNSNAAVRMLNGSIGLIYKTEDDSTQLEALPTSLHDAYITSITLGPRGLNEASSRLYYTTQNHIFSIKENGKDNQIVIAGFINVTLHGYNFGNVPTDILNLTVAGKPCSTITLLNSKTVNCLVTKVFSNATLSNEDVYIQTRFGNMTGIHLLPETMGWVPSGRTVVGSIQIEKSIIRPYSIFYLTLAETQREYLYWSDLATRSIYRSSGSGSEVVVLLREVPRVYGVTAIPSPHHSSDQIVFYADAENRALMRIAVDQSGKLIDGPVNVINGIPEPRSVIVDEEGKYVFVTYLDGLVLKLLLSKALASSGELGVTLAFNDYSSLPQWISVVAKSQTYSRFDGITLLERGLSAYATDDLWKEQYIVIADTVTNTIQLVNNDSSYISTLSLNHGFGDNAVIWPRSLVARKQYPHEKKAEAHSTSAYAVLYAGELLGKIWKIEINMKDSKLRQFSLKTPRLIQDLSSYTASIELRRLLNMGKPNEFGISRVFPEIKD